MQWMCRSAFRVRAAVINWWLESRYQKLLEFYNVWMCKVFHRLGSETNRLAAGSQQPSKLPRSGNWIGTHEAEDVPLGIPRFAFCLLQIKHLLSSWVLSGLHSQWFLFLCITLSSHPRSISLLFNSLLVDHEQQLTATFDAAARWLAGGRGACIIALFFFCCVSSISPYGMRGSCHRLVFRGCKKEKHFNHRRDFYLKKTKQKKNRPWLGETEWR